MDIEDEYNSHGMYRRMHTRCSPVWLVGAKYTQQGAAVGAESDGRLLWFYSSACMVAGRVDIPCHLLVLKHVYHHHD